jgi:hypothetical protein
MEIVAFLRPSLDAHVSDWSVSYIEWQLADTNVVSAGVLLRMEHDEYTNGAGGKHVVPMVQFLRRTRLLVTTTPEVIRGEYYERGVVLIRPRTPILTAAADSHPARSALVDMSGVTRITTDGSWAQAGTATDHLTGNLTVTCAAAVVLQKDDVFVGAIRVKCDGEIHRSAYSTEVVGLALAAQLSSDTAILSDCQAALKLCHRSSHGKRMNSPLSQVLSSGIHNRAHNMRWVKAHPERSKPIQQFTLDDRSIYAADLLAGGRTSEFMAFTGLSADKIAETSDVAVLADYSNLAMITVVDDSGRPVLEPTRVREKRLMLEEYLKNLILF